MKKTRRFQVRRADLAALCRQTPEFTPAAKTSCLHSFDCETDIFAALVQSIVAQQLAVRAADAVLARLRALVTPTTPENLLAASPEELRKCGLSGRKTEYLRGVAEAARSGRLDFARLDAMTDAEIVGELVGLKGVGVWTAEMMLIFSFGRPDVFSWRDLGVRHGLMKLAGRDAFSDAELEGFRRRVSPYGTLASLCCWRANA